MTVWHGIDNPRSLEVCSLSDHGSSVIEGEEAEWVKILAGRGFARRGSVVGLLAVDQWCSSWVSRGFASRGSVVLVVGLLAVDQWCSSFARRGSSVGLLAVGVLWVCLPWVWVCSPWVCRGFARRGYGFCLLWVSSPSPLAPTPLALLLVLSMKFMEF
nr:hypothetical protein CFP56_16343 [Quercus suber]